MAKSPAEVLDFLRDLARRSKPRAEDDVAQVDAYARDELGIDKIEPWDRAYAAEKLREARYSYSDAEVKRKALWHRNRRSSGLRLASRCQVFGSEAQR